MLNEIALIKKAEWILWQSRRRPNKMGDMGMFSSLLFCADCGGKIYQCRTNEFKPEQEYFICSTYSKDRTLCTTHSIRNVALEEIIIRNLREAGVYRQNPCIENFRQERAQDFRQGTGNRNRL